MEKDYFTGEIRCTECGKWFEPEELYMGYCENCRKQEEYKIEKHINKRRGTE